MRLTRCGATSIAVLALCVGLTGCTGEPTGTVADPMPVPTSTASTSPSGESTSAPEHTPTLLPDGSALANHEYFDYVNEQLLEVNAQPTSTAIIENLVSAGFPESELEVTPEKTAYLGRAADSIQFAVRTSKDCLLGQFRSGSYTSAVGPPIHDGVCLVGLTKPLR